jgi:hypothetical protein
MPARSRIVRRGGGGPSAAVDEALAAFAADCYADPLAFVLGAYPWGQAGTPLAQHDGPDRWQTDFLLWLGEAVAARGFDGVHPVPPIRSAVSSGHGVGKGVMASWLVHWIMSTRPHAQGTITANTITQLQTKTWAAIRTWLQLCVTAPWFVVNSERMYHRDHPESWFCALQNSQRDNAEAFAGQHAAGSTSFYVFDEASAIDQAIFEVAEGGLSDGEPMIFLFGNPTRNSGPFYATLWGSGRDRWHGVVVDSRDSRFPNKAQIAEWADTYGEDSDFFRVRVRGLPPRGSDLQFIDLDRIWGAQRREAVTVLADEPLIVGVDVSDGGSAWNVARFRCGADARTIPPIRLPGEAVRHSRDPWLAVLAGILTGEHGPQRRKVAHMFVDSAFGAPYVERLRAMGYAHVSEVRFGAPSPDRAYENMRAYMWGRGKEWLTHGALDPTDIRLETDLAAPGWHLNKQDRIVLESKQAMAARGVDSPDDADALMLTFAAPVRAVAVPGPSTMVRRGPTPPRGSGWLGH